MPLIILAILGVAVVYVRLLNGPISLAVVADPISRSIAAELPGITVAIEDALVRLTDSGGVEFRMRNVRFSDSDGATIAVAPLAAVNISSHALWSGRIAPDKVVLIEPRLLLVSNESGGVSMSFSRDHTAAPGAVRQSPSGTASAAEPAEATQQIDLARLIAQAGQNARRGTNAASYLREIGVRNATIVLDRASRQSVWTVIEGNIDLEHKKRRSTVVAEMSMASATGPWGLSLKIEEAEKANTVVLEAALKDLVPRGLASIVPELAALDMVDTPVSGQARMELMPDGGIIGGTMGLDVGRGSIVVPGQEKHPIDIDKGRIDLRYDAASRQIVIAPSTFDWSQGTVTLAGTIKANGGPAGGGGWSLDLSSNGGRLSADDFAVPPINITEASVRGDYSSDTGAFTLALARLKAGGAQVEAAGRFVATEGRQSFAISGQIGPTSAEVAKAIWPRMLAPAARRWSGLQITKGRINGGSFKVAGGQGADRQLSFTLDASDLAFIPGKTLPAIEAPRALVRVEGDGLEVSIPDASSQFGNGRRLQLKSGRLTAVELASERTPGEIAFRMQASLPAAIEYLELEPLGIGSLGLPTDTMDGKVEGQIKLSLPLVTGLELADMKVEAKAKISDGRAKQAIGPHDIQSATINIDMADGAVNASGQMLVGGVSSKLTFQRILGAADDRQPPLRLSANLDAADRNQLGLDINHIVSGDVPIDLMVSRVAGQQQLRVRADLTGSELHIEPVAWRKQPGRQALLEFDVMRAGPKTKTELQNFRVVGDDIAIDGVLVLDPKGRLTEFQFPNFALTLVSRLVLQGALRADNVWDIKAKAAYWDGRDFFRQLFAIGQAPERQAPVKKDQSGVDLKAELDTVQGHGDIALKSLRLQMSRRAGKLSGLIARGIVEGGKPIEVGLLQTANEPRKLVVQTDDAGQAFRMVGFYPNMQGGEMRLDINLDGKGTAEKTGTLEVRRFAILGDTVLSEVLQTPAEVREGIEAGRRPKRKLERQSVDFDSMHLPFLVGYNQFVMQDAQLRGPLLGASMTGKADFKAQQIDICGTYSPLQGLNSLPNIVPGAGQVLTGPKGEGMVGITFRAVGPMGQPNVIVNPLSMLLPGFTRGLAELCPSLPRVIPRDERPPERSKVKLPQAPGGGDVYRQPNAQQRAADPVVSEGWSTERKK